MRAILNRLCVLILLLLQFGLKLSAETHSRRELLSSPRDKQTYDFVAEACSFGIAHHYSEAYWNSMGEVATLHTEFLLSAFMPAVRNQFSKTVERNLSLQDSWTQSIMNSPGYILAIQDCFNGDPGKILRFELKLRLAGQFARVSATIMATLGAAKLLGLVAKGGRKLFFTFLSKADRSLSSSMGMQVARQSIKVLATAGPLSAITTSSAQQSSSTIKGNKKDSSPDESYFPEIIPLDKKEIEGLSSMIEWIDLSNQINDKQQNKNAWAMLHSTTRIYVCDRYPGDPSKQVLALKALQKQMGVAASVYFTQPDCSLPASAR